MRRDLPIKFDGIDLVYDWYVTGHDLSLPRVYWLPPTRRAQA